PALANLHSREARHSGGDFCGRFLLPPQPARDGNIEPKSFRREVLAKEARLPPPEFRQRVIVVASAGLAVPDQIDVAQLYLSARLAASLASPFARSPKLRNRSSE